MQRHPSDDGDLTAPGHRQHAAPPYRPYADGPAEVRFRIGLRALDPENWIEVDDRLAAWLAEKERVATAHPEQAFAAVPGCEAAQAEVLDMLAAYLPRRYPEIYRLGEGGRSMIVAPPPIDGMSMAREVPLGDSEALAPALARAAALVGDDLCLMAPAAGGYVLTAASLTAPAFWRLADKIGRPMVAIHGPVPGWADGIGPRVDRIFANLKVDSPVWRANWSVTTTPDTFTPVPKQTLPLAADTPAEAVLDRLWLRVERQTLRRLPLSGVILFTIRTYLSALRGVVTTADHARALADAMRALGPDEQAYKSFARFKAPLLAALDRLSDGARV